MKGVLKKRIVYILIILFSAFIPISAEYFNVFDIWQEKIYDRFFIEQTPAKDILIVGIDDISLKSLGQWPLPREFFGKVIGNLENSNNIGLDVLFSENSRIGLNDDLAFSEFLKKSKSEVVLARKFDDRGEKIIEPIELLKNNAKLGFINVEVGSDGIVRKLKTTFEKGDHLTSILSSKTNTPESIRIAFRGKAKTFPTISFVDVYEGKIPLSVISGKTILIGATAQDLQDILQTPFGRMSGVEVLANALNTINNSLYFKEVPTTIVFITSLLVALLVVLSSVYLKNIIVLVTILLIQFIFINLSSIFLFSEFILLPNIPINLSFFIASGLIISYQYISESKEKRFIRKTFEYYLMPEVVKELVEHPEKLKLGGEKKRVTIMFTDIRGFTTISEKLSPESLTRVLNGYLTEMTDAVMGNRGLVDKYIGDAVMAFWGAPIENKNQAKNACEAVLEMSKRLKTLNIMWQKEGLPELAFGAGLNVGEVVVGNIGSEKRFNYSILGDEVNFCSRLEGLTKTYGAVCLVSESVYEVLKESPEFFFRELDLVIVKGKKEPKNIYELLISKPSDDELRAFILFKEGKEAYTKGDWDKAISLFKAVLLIINDTPSKLFIERCLHLKENQPEMWSGVYEFKTK